MAQVFLARDLRHGRKVAIKVFLPEVASSFGTGRFLREIRTAANLSHPNILPLFDSGEAGGLLYFVMPYVEGESLADRVKREGQLPLDDALAITRQVATALHYAHARGIVHRDIKPGNILLSGGNAFVADFGIAHALGETGAEKLTSTGLVIGTPAYMSPEQSGEAGRLDGRADIYSLGCVLYEMLVGEPPFTGRSAQVILARHSVAEVPSPRAARTTIPEAVEEAILRALAKSPADRFATGEEFAAALAPERLARPARIAPRSVKIPLHRSWIIATAGVALLGVIAVVTLASRRGSGTPSANPELVAVLPFQVATGADSELVKLGTQSAELIAQRLPGDGGPRAVAPAEVAVTSERLLSHRQTPPESAGAVARALGAGLFLTGTLSRAGDRLELRARLLRSLTGGVVATVENLSAARDSVAPLFDRVVARLLAGSTGIPTNEANALAELPLPAIRGFIAARRAYTRGARDSAARRFNEVLRADSSFVPAALGLAATGSDSLRDRGIRLAEAQRHRLSTADRLYLDGLVGRNWPGNTRIPDQLATLDSAVVAAPDQAERWFQLGDRLFRRGPWTGIPDILQRARGAFRQALDLEPAFVPALGRLLDLASSAGDTAEVRKLGTRYLALDSVGDLADYYRWRVAMVLGDRKTLRTVRDRLPALSEATVMRMVNVTELDGLPLEDALGASDALWSRSGLRHEMRYRYTKRIEIALNRGRPMEAAELARRLFANTPMRKFDILSEIVDALYWDADTTLAARLVREAGPRMEALPTSGVRVNDPVYYACAVGLWRLSRGELDRVPLALGALRHAITRPEEDLSLTPFCTAVLDAQLAAAEGRADARTRLQELDSLARISEGKTWILTAANLTAARLWEAQGDLARALGAIRRRAYITDIDEPRVLVAQATFFREEGRLAAKTGDREGAIRAYRKYLALRADPEPVLVPQRDKVKAELAALERTPPKQ